jgi:chromosome segregation ATPase
LNNDRYTWPDIVSMDEDELGRVLVGLDEAADSIETMLDGMVGDQKVRAQDKMRHCSKWAAKIRDEILEFEDELQEEPECRCEELEAQVESYREQLEDLKSSVKAHLSDELATIIFRWGHAK